MTEGESFKVERAYGGILVTGSSGQSIFLKEIDAVKVAQEILLMVPLVKFVSPCYSD